MLDQRLPTTLTLSALALIFSGAGVIQHNPTPPLFTALIIVQALSLIVAPNHPRISTATYIAAFITALLVGYSTGFELFLGVFLITALTATGHPILAILSATTITLGGFYSPTNARIEFDIGAVIIFITIIALAHLLGLWIHHTHQQHLNSQRFVWFLARIHPREQDLLIAGGGYALGALICAVPAVGQSACLVIGAIITGASWAISSYGKCNNRLHVDFRWTGSVKGERCT